MNNPIPARKIKKIFQLLLSGSVNIRRTARALHISRNTLKKYLSDLKTLIIFFPDQLADFKFYLEHLKKESFPTEKCLELAKTFQANYQNILDGSTNLKIEWQKYLEQNPKGYCSSQFNSYFSRWCTDNGVSSFVNHWKILNIPPKEQTILKKWRKCGRKSEWEKAVIVIESNNGRSLEEISHKIDRSTDHVKKYIKGYRKRGLEGILRKKIEFSAVILQRIRDKKENLMKLLHETPALHGINRASWDQASLAQAYQAKYNTTISTSMISAYILEAGYSFRKAKEVLTSPDPLFREKLERITNILSHLTPEQKFFSVDEFGPFAVKIKGGRSYVKNDELKTYPQLQKSKGCIICTAALELSQNQVTHFYSAKKNTEEMIKLLDIILIKYKGQRKIFFSWDAASWHASKKLYAKMEEVNSETYRNKNGTPVVELAPLPSSAQFLNVIESVFSGLAKAIIHNSDYASAAACKSAIDLYFEKRNDHFLQHPQKAGKKIWGKELIVPVFDETKNCKDPKWR